MCQRYGDFILQFEFALPVGGNSGVFYRVDESAGLAWHSGPEMQLLDDAVHPDGEEPTTRNGALYGLLAPEQETRIGPGSFMHAALVVRRGAVEHWLGNRMVLSYRLDDPALHTLIESSISSCSTTARRCAFAACRSKRWAERRPWIGTPN